MNLVDSCGWLEVGEGGRNAGFFEEALKDTHKLLVPALSLFEVHRHMSRHYNGRAAEEMVATMRQGRIVDLDAETATMASQQSLLHRLAAMDALIYATALRHGAIFWTQDAAFKDLPSVRYHPKKAAP